MTKLFALAPALIGPLVACAALGASPAQAQYYYRPYAPRYVEPLYDAPPPGYYREQPRMYREPRMRDVPMMPLTDVQPMLRSMGMVSIARPRADGNGYVTEANDPSGQRMRVRIDPRSGSIVSMRPIAQPTPVMRNAPLPPTRPPEIETTAIPDVAPSSPEPAVVAPATPPVANVPPVEKPAVAAVPPLEKPADVRPAPEPPKQAAAPAPTPSEVRVIAIPAAPKVEAKTETPPAAPAAAPAGNSTAGVGTGTGTGTGTGSVSAGTASVAARDGKTPAPTAD